MDRKLNRIKIVLTEKDVSQTELAERLGGSFSSINSHYDRFVPTEEICEKNDYNLNILRHIAAADTKVQQGIDAHLHGDIPAHDIDQMADYWEACPTLRDTLT